MSFGSEEISFRPVPEEADDDLEEYVQYAFWPGQGANPDHWDETHVPRQLTGENGELWGLFVGDSLRSVLIDLDLRAWIRGGWRDVSGVSSIVTPPEYRRQGHIIQLAQPFLRALRDRGCHFLAGWEFSSGYWRRFGVGLAGTVQQWTGSPRTFQSVLDTQTGEYRRVGPDCWETLDRIHRKHAERFELTVDRTETWWRNMVFEPSRTRRHAAVWERDGEARGYVVYEMSSEGSSIRVTDMGYLDREAFRHLCYYLGLHDMRYDEVTLYRPEGNTLFDVVEDPDRLDCSAQPGPSLRIVDVTSALEVISYPKTVEGTLTLDVTDEILPENHGVFRLSIADGTAICERASDDADPDVTVDVATLSQLLVGYRSVETLERTYDLTVDSEASRQTLAAAFPERQVFLYDQF